MTTCILFQMFDIYINQLKRLLYIVKYTFFIFKVAFLVPSKWLCTVKPVLTESHLGFEIVRFRKEFGFTRFYIHAN